jgi:hypothetical protein
MRINNKYNNTFILENETIRKVADFTYLGSNISEDRRAFKDVNIRIRQARGAFSRLRKSGNRLTLIKAQKLKYLTHV